MTRTLRPHQQFAYDKVRAEWGKGVLRTAVVHPTGAGKGDLIAKVVIDEAAAGGRALVLCHRAEILDQLTDRCAAYDASIPVGRVQAAQNQSRRPITMAMIQTLASEKRRTRLPRPSLIVIDECHRVGATSYTKTLAHFGAFDNTRTLGLTATLVRGDRKGLGDVFQSVADSRDIRWAVEEGLLVPPRGKVVVADHLDLDQAKVARGDYVDAELGELVSQDAEQIAKAWCEHAENRITIAFTPTVDSAQELTNALIALGVAAETVTGETSTGDRKDMYARLANGTTRVLTSVNVLTEGFDVPSVSCVLMARPTRLPGVYTQCVGRGLRLDPGKVDCLVLDVVGISRHQKLMTLIDLSPSAEYDTTEIDRLPCDECGMTPCGCPPGERDPDGGRRRLIGPAAYEEIDDMFATSELNWLFTRGGIRFLPVGDRLTLLWPDEESGLYHAGHCTSRGYDGGRYVGRDGQWDPVGPLPLDEARRRAEEWALAVEPSIAAKGSSWRKRGGRASEAQLGFARGLGIAEPEQYTKSRLSDEISIALASRVIDG